MSYNYRKKPAYKASLKDRVVENYDVVLVTIGGILLLGFLGFPISTKTTIIDNNNPLIKR